MAVPVRRMWIVVLLAGVFLMHGAPSMATELPVPAAHLGTATSDAGLDFPAAALPSADEVTAQGEERANHSSSTSHPMTSHVWNACLAVLLVGMWLLAAGAFRRLPSATDRRVTPRIRGSIGWVRPPRPPDLAALCLLRT